MLKRAEGSRERRWVILGEDGRYTTLGRASDPSEEEIQRAEDSLKAQHLAGWLSVMQGSPYVGTTPRLMMVRPLAEPTAAFEDAVAKFERCREGRMGR